MSINKGLLWVFFWAYFMSISTVNALEGDKNQPITLDSDSGFYDDKKYDGAEFTITLPIN